VLCLKVVTIHLFVAERTLHFAREVQGNPCVLERTRAHNLRHARVDEQAVEDLAPHISEAFGSQLAEASLVAAPSDATARQRLAAAVSQLMEIELNAVDKVRKRMNREIDGPVNLSRLHAACVHPTADP
jgi:hypothetical protein